ncbi:MAG: TonB-dependent receptor [Rikenellaceae bacterium]|nr:TonB-dependent receptor [Rikenellaceae bacterium]
MKKILSLIFLSCFVWASAFAQTTSKLTAQLVDASNGEPILGATVEYASTKNPDKKRYVTSGYNGSIAISSLTYGDYKITISFIGYESLEKEVTVKAAKTSLGKLEMKPTSEMIESVVKEVQSLRTSQKGDTVSYNAGAFKVSNDADVEGLLKKMPGININNGEVEAQGETVKKVFVDGKEFFGEDVTTAIKSLPAQAVDRIEVYNKLSDQAEFSGMDDGEGYKALNIVTHKHMRQGQFGKMYAGYGYDNNDNAIANHKYLAGGNVNIFQGDHRVTLLGLFNNINQQNFSFEDILEVSGGGGRGVGQYMVRPQAGVATVNSAGLNYSGTWGKKDNVTFQGSYFFNNTNTVNNSTTEKWYEAPSPIDTLYQKGYSDTRNNNHRVNARLDWKISPNHSLMSRTGVSFQLNNPFSTTNGQQWGQSGLSIIDNYSKTKNHGYNISEFLQYRAKLGKDGRTLTIGGNVRYNNREYQRNSWSNTAEALRYDPDTVNVEDLEAPLKLRYLYTQTPSSSLNFSGTFNYTEPLSKYSQLSMQYRFSMNNSKSDKSAYITGDDFDPTGLTPAPNLSTNSERTYTTHRVGPGFRFSKERNTVVANVYYQHALLDGMLNEGAKNEQKIKKDFDNVTYFLMTNIFFNKENSLRVHVSSSTDEPSLTQLQNIKDVTNAQYVSTGNSNLDQSYSHSIRAHYVNSNVEKGRTLMVMGMFSATQNYIGRSVYYNPSSEITGLDYTPLQYSTYENMNGQWSVRGMASFGTPLSFMKCNLNLRAGVSYSITPSKIDGKINNASNMGYNFGAVLGSNISENVDFTLSWHGNYNEALNSQANVKNRYFNHSASLNMKVSFWKGFTFTGSCVYNQYMGFTNDYNEDYLLCNLFLGKKIFKNQRGEIQIGVNDVFNQNSAFSRSTGSGYTQNSWNNVIGRYYTIQFVYNLRNFGKKGSKNIGDYEGMGGRGGRGGMGGGRPMGPPPGGMHGGPR